MFFNKKKRINRVKGKILRIKYGYNPNSSSIGSVIFNFPSILLLFGVIFGSITAFILTIVFNRKNNKNSSTDKE